jgi:hypothetical protein
VTVVQLLSSNIYINIYFELLPYYHFTFEKYRACLDKASTYFGDILPYSISCCGKSISESRKKPQDLKVEGKIFTGVSCFKYLGNMINNGNRNDNCVKERIQAGNRAYFANLSTLKSKIISRAAKLQVYKTINKTCCYIRGRNMDLKSNTENVREKNNTHNLRTSDGK